MGSTQASSTTGRAIQAELEALKTLDHEYTTRVSTPKPERWRAVWQNVLGLKCFSTQPDGVPCAGIEIDCENCEELLTSLQAWRKELEELLQKAIQV